jgi:hypothetical protein
MINQDKNNMKTTQDNKCADKTNETATVRMGREVPGKKASGCDSEKDATCSDKKEKKREGAASALV